MSDGTFRARLPIPEVAGTTFTELVREHFDPGRPCVLRGLYDARALGEWIAGLAVSGERLACVVSRRSDIALISDADRPPVERAAELPEIDEFVAELPLAEIWRRMRAPGELAPLVAPGESLYVFSAPLPESLTFPPGGAASSPLPELYSDPRGRQLLVNAPGLLNRCHAHIHSYLLHQVHGPKRVRVFSPADTPHLYPNAERRSAVRDFDRVDRERFPLVARATAYEAVLAPGDVLFLPSYWWHEIRVDELAVSVGFHAPCGAARDAATTLHEGIAAALERSLPGAPDPEILAGIAAIVFTAAARDVARDGVADTVAGLRFTYE
jgi:hypothetical protein